MELSKHIKSDGVIDWHKLKDPMVARENDTLTLTSFEQIGFATVDACKVIDTLVKRGIVVDSSALCSDPHQIAGAHAKWSLAQRRRQANQKRRDNEITGGRPQVYTDDQIRDYHQRIRTGELQAADLADVYGVAASTMSRRCAELGLAWPVTVIDSRTG